MLDKAEYSAFESTLNSPIVSYRIVSYHGFNNLQHSRVRTVVSRINKLQAQTITCCHANRFDNIIPDKQIIGEASVSVVCINQRYPASTTMSILTLNLHNTCILLHYLPYTSQRPDDYTTVYEEITDHNNNDHDSESQNNNNNNRQAYRLRRC